MKYVCKSVVNSRGNNKRYISTLSSEQVKHAWTETPNKTGPAGSKDLIQNTQSTQSDSALVSELHTPEPAEPVSKLQQQTNSCTIIRIRRNGK